MAIPLSIKPRWRAGSNEAVSFFAIAGESEYRHTPNGASDQHFG